MKTQKAALLVLLMSGLLLQACGPSTQSAIETGIAQTQQISALETAAAGGAPVQQTAGSAQSSGVPFISVSTNTNCRSGPRADYTLLTTINVGQQLEVLKTFSNEYVLVKNPNGGGDCWLFLQFANTTDFSAFNLPIATQPPTPMPTNTPKPVFDWNGTWLMSSSVFGNSSTGRNDFSVVVSQSGATISGSFVTASGDTVTFFGSLSQNGQLATGTLETGSHDGSSTGTFQWQIKTNNLNQFIGHSGDSGSYWGSGEWCGARLGAAMPSPCYGP